MQLKKLLYLSMLIINCKIFSGENGVIFSPNGLRKHWKAYEQILASYPDGNPVRAFNEKEIALMRNNFNGFLKAHRAAAQFVDHSTPLRNYLWQDQVPDLKAGETYAKLLNDLINNLDEIVNEYWPAKAKEPQPTPARPIVEPRPVVDKAVIDGLLAEVKLVKDHPTVKTHADLFGNLKNINDELTPTISQEKVVAIQKIIKDLNDYIKTPNIGKKFNIIQAIAELSKMKAKGGARPGKVKIDIDIPVGPVGPGPRPKVPVADEEPPPQPKKKADKVKEPVIEPVVKVAVDKAQLDKALGKLNTIQKDKAQYDQLPGNLQKILTDIIRIFNSPGLTKDVFEGLAGTVDRFEGYLSPESKDLAKNLAIKGITNAYNKWAKKG